MLVLSFTVASRYYNCCTDSSTSPISNVLLSFENAAQFRDLGMIATNQSLLLLLSAI
jgi:hypothetical protein